MKVKGYASVFGNIDSYGEVVDAGAFADWIVSNPGKQVPLLWMHDSYQKLPIGMTTGLHEDAHGLQFSAEVAETELGRDVVTLIKSGAVRSSSFAYRTIGEEKIDDIWHLKQLDLIEVSAVTTSYGANPKATIEMMPDDGDPPPKSQVHPASELSGADIDAIFAKHFRKD
jgi:HK97 family phage prohead protease